MRLRRLVGKHLEKIEAKLAKAHSAYVVDLYVPAGWVVKTEFRVPGDEQPYEYILEWLQDSEPVRPEIPKKQSQ